MHSISDTIERKFVDSLEVDDWQIETEDGWVDITHINVTVEYEVYQLVTTSCFIECADNHIVFKSDNTEVFVKDLKAGDKIKGQHGLEIVISVTKTDRKENMIDLSVTGNHTFYAHGLLHHNTTTAAAYFVWYIIFNENKNVAILANKQATADEILHRIRLAYENLPKWLQQGVKSFNRRSIELENGSRVFCAATSSSGIRGRTINCVTGDTIIKICDDDFSNEREIKIKDLYTNANSSIYKYENISTQGSNFHMITDFIGSDDTENIDTHLTKYHKYYNDIISNAKNRKVEFGVVEKHHIVPRSFGGSNSEENIVNLSLREHFVVHKLLVKMTTGKQKSSMLRALFMMSNTRGIRLSSRLYEQARLAASVYFTRKLSEETKLKLKDFQLALWSDPEYKAKMKSISNSESTSKKRSESIKEYIRINQDEHKSRMLKINRNPDKIKKTAEWHTGKKRSDETRQKIRESRIGLTPGNKDRKSYYNPDTLETKLFKNIADVPSGWIIGTGKKKPDRGEWYHDSNGNIKAFKSSDKIPDGWFRGRK